MPSLRNYTGKYIVILLIALVSCSKSKDTTTGEANNGNGGGASEGTNCVISTISQVNSGSGAEASLSAFYTSNSVLIKLVIYDSIHKAKNFEADFNYVTADSVKMGQYQYLLLDGYKRVTVFVTKSDMSDPEHADDYVFRYTYNSAGYLSEKELFINGSKKANFSTVYSYTNNQLTACLMTSPSSGNLKALEATLSYDSSTSIKNWIYTFPEAMEGYPYIAVLNFGKHPANPLKKVVTKIYDPSSGNLIDTWTTDYRNYKIDPNGYVSYAQAAGDLQQGMAAFYGKQISIILVINRYSVEF